MFSKRRMNYPSAVFCTQLVLMDAVLAQAQPSQAKGAAELEPEGAARQAWTLIEKGQLAPAQALLTQSLELAKGAARLPLLRALAALHQQRRDFVAAAATFHDILQLAPEDRDAVRGRVFAILRMGAPQLAARYAAQHAKSFTEAELLDLQQAQAGRSVNWGTLEARVGIGAKRFQATDRALAKSAEVRAQHVRAGALDTPSGRRTDFDRLVALRDRVKMEEVLALYKDLQRRRVSIPPYALVAVADAYLYQNQPKLARDLYLQALASSRDDRDYPNREWQRGLFNAYCDANDFTAARRLIDQLVKEVPPLLHRGLRGMERDNEIYEQVRSDAVHVRMYADALDAAQRMVKELLRDAPFSQAARLALADLLQQREQPRRAQEQYASVLIDDPANISAAAGIAETALALDEPGIASARIDALAAHYPENRDVQRIAQQLRAYQWPQLEEEFSFGRSTTTRSNRGQQDWLADVRVHSPVFANHFRIFAHSFNASAEFETDTFSRVRLGIGAEFRSRAWLLSAELSHGPMQIPGGTLRAAWLPSDHFKVDLDVDSNSNDIPLPASGTGVTAAAVRLGGSYIRNESLSLSAHFASAWYSDTNLHLAADADWTERWRSGAIYKLDTRVSISASRNTLTKVIYFNPLRDLSAEAQVINEWTLWRRARNSLRQRLIVGGGLYAQERYGVDATVTARCEHEWHFHPLRTLNYGALYERHPYDGVINHRVAFFVNSNWYF